MGSGKLDSNVLKGIQLLLEDDNCVITYKLVSKKFDIHVNKAKEYLQTLDDECRTKGDKEITATYFLSGTYQEQDVDYLTTKVVVVSRPQLAAARASLQAVVSEHVYSLQRQPVCNATALYGADLQQQPDDVSAHNSHDAIRCEAAQLISEAERSNVLQAAAPTKPPDKHTTPTGKHGYKQGAKPLTSETETAAPKEESAATPDNQEDERKAESKQTQPKRGAIASMFAKAGAEKNKTKSPPKKATNGSVMASFLKKGAEKPAAVFAEKSPPVPARGQQQREEPAADDGSDSQNEESKPAAAVRFGAKAAASRGRTGRGATKKRAAKPAVASREKKRLRILSVASDSSDDSGEEAKREDSEPEPEPEPAPAGSTVQSDDDAATAAAPVTSQAGNRRRRKLVSKTFLDDDGFMVTKQEYESCSENEAEAPPVGKGETCAGAAADPKVAEPSVKKEQPATDAPAKQADRLPHKKKQPNILSFFKKK